MNYFFLVEEYLPVGQCVRRPWFFFWIVVIVGVAVAERCCYRNPAYSTNIGVWVGVSTSSQNSQKLFFLCVTRYQSFRRDSSDDYELGKLLQGIVFAVDLWICDGWARMHGHSPIFNEKNDFIFKFHELEGKKILFRYQPDRDEVRHDFIISLFPINSPGTTRGVHKTMDDGIEGLCSCCSCCCHCQLCVTQSQVKGLLWGRKQGSCDV